MIDTTHDGLPGAMAAIRALPAGDLFAMYDTGSGDIAGTAADWAQIPAGLGHVTIDQGFTGSPNMAATVRDCEDGAWTLSRAVDRTGWNVPRPTLYLGYPDTAQAAWDAGWRGDVWIAGPQNSAPAVPPAMPPGITCVAQQWAYPGDWDVSAVFDASWPGTGPPGPPGITYLTSAQMEAIMAALPMLSLNMTDAALPCWSVHRLQGILASTYGYYKGAVDGVYGPATKAAVVTLQARYGLTQDGVCGPLTWMPVITGAT